MFRIVLGALLALTLACVAFLAWLGGALAAASGRVAAFPWREGR